MATSPTRPGTRPGIGWARRVFIAVVVGVFLGLVAAPEAQGPFAAQIVRALRAYGFTSPGVFSGTSVTTTGNVTAGASASLGWTGRSLLTSSADGIVTLTNAAGTDFTRLNFGGATASFPAIAKIGAQALGIVAGDGSTNYDLTVRNYTLIAGGSIIWTGRNILQSSADGVLFSRNSGNTSSLTWQNNGTPTCSTNCGTSPSITGNNSAGTVTMGATGSPASGWVVTFAGSGWAAAPSCDVVSALTGMVAGKKAIVVATTTTTFTVTTDGTAPANGDKYTYTCTLGA